MKKIILISIVTLFLWLVIILILPFGNHLTAIMTASARDAERTMLDRIFLIKPLSIVKVNMFSVSCDADLIVFDSYNKKPKYVPAPNSSIFLAGELYIQDSFLYLDNEKAIAEKFLKRLVNNCSKNKGPENIPPLASAIISYNYYLYDLLIKQGADPDYPYKSIVSKKKLTPRKLLNHLLERELVDEKNRETLQEMNARINEL